MASFTFTSPTPDQDGKQNQRRHCSRKSVVFIAVSLFVTLATVVYYYNSQETFGRPMVKINEINHIDEELKDIKIFRTSTLTDPQNTSNDWEVETTDVKKSETSKLGQCNVMDNFQITNETYECVNMKSSKNGNVFICIHDVMQDKFISKSLKTHGQWEATFTDQLEIILHRDRELNLLDFGANIGVYSLIALKHSRKIVAVDANPMNLGRLRRSLQLNEFEQLGTLVLNALYDDYITMTVRIKTTDNMGGAHVYKISPDDDQFMAVRAIHIDDLLPIISFQKAVLKIDIESAEPRAFRFASRLFKHVYIPYVMMEWELIRKRQKDGALFLIDFFKSRNYSAFSNFDCHSPLSPVSWRIWPQNIVWKINVY